jgi:hypothetical protein
MKWGNGDGVAAEPGWLTVGDGEGPGSAPPRSAHPGTRGLGRGVADRSVAGGSPEIFPIEVPSPESGKGALRGRLAAPHAHSGLLPIH